MVYVISNNICCQVSKQEMNVELELSTFMIFLRILAGFIEAGSARTALHCVAYPKATQSIIRNRDTYST